MLPYPARKWNTEDFSLVSGDPSMTEIPLFARDARTRNIPYTNDNGTPLTRAKLFGSLYRGLRATQAFVRPYCPKTAGLPLFAEFDLPNVEFSMAYIAS